MKQQKTIMVRNITAGLYNKEELDNIQKELLNYNEIMKILNKSRGSIKNLISNGTLTPVKFIGKYYFPKQQVLELVKPIQEQKNKKNTDWELDKEYAEFMGIQEDKVIPAKITDAKSGKQILQDNKEKQNKTDK